MMKPQNRKTFDSLRATGHEASKEQQQLASIFNRIFSSNDGAVALAFLRRVTVEAVLGPDASDGALRMQEGKRQLMRTIEGLIASGGRLPESKSGGA